MVVVYWFYPFVAVLGAFTSFLNAMAGGAHMFTLPVLDSLGVNTVDANTSARVCSFVTAVVGIYAYRHVGVIDRPTLASLFIFCTLGSLVGTYFSVVIPRPIYENILYVMLFIISIYLLVQSSRSSLQKAVATGSEEEDGKNNSPFGLRFTLLNFLFGLYVGFMFIGAGILMFYTYIGIMKFSLQKINAMKYLIIAFTTAFSVLSLSLVGEIDWILTSYLCAGGVVGVSIGIIIQFYINGIEKYVAKLITGMALALAIKIVFDLVSVHLI